MAERVPEISEAFLLENRDFLRSLACSLVFDEHKADDVVQQACLAALEHPPKEAGPLRSWLARVVRNLAFTMLKREGERASRERVAARPEAEGLGEELDLEHQQLVLEALRRLRQPYRTAIYLRYYRDLSPARIAELEDEPIATVKTRLRRGLALLREELDRRHPEGRASWCAALAPFASGAGVAPPSATLYAALKGMILMKKPVLASLSIAVLLAVATVSWVATRDGDGSAERAPTGGVAVKPEAPSATLAAGPAELELEGDTAAAAPARTELTPAPVAAKPERRTAAVTGRVLGELGRPVAGAEVMLLPDDDEGLFGLLVLDASGSRAVARTTSDTGGRFELPLTEAGGYHVAVGADGFAPFRKETVADPERDNDVGDLTLDPGVRISGRVVDRAGAPLAGVQIHRPLSSTSGEVILVSGEALLPVVATSDSGGYFAVERQAVGPWELSFRSGEHPPEVVTGETRRAGEHVSDLLVTLADGYAIEGRLADVPDDSGDGLHVVALPAASSTDGFARFAAATAKVADVAADGSFRLQGLEEGATYHLHAQAGGSTFGPRTRSDTVEARAGDRGVTLRYTRATALAFRVVDAVSGDPLTDFEVEAGSDFLSPLLDDRGDVRTHHPGGLVRYEDVDSRMLTGMGAARLRVLAVGYETYETGGLTLAPGTELDLGVVRLRRAPVVRVTVLDERTGAPIEGARVSLQRESEPADTGLATGRSVRVRLGQGDSEPVITTEGNDMRSGETDADGVCILNSLPGERVQVRVASAGYAPQSTDAFTLPSADHSETVRLAEGSTVTVLVVDEAGTPLAGEQVQHRAPSDGPEQPFGTARAGNRQTDSEGRALFHNLEPGVHRFRLSEDPFQGPLGAGTMRVLRPGSDSAGAPWSEVDVVAGTPGEVTLTATPRSALAGAVTEAGLPLAGAEVRLLPAEEGIAPIPALQATGPSARTDSRGRYRLDDVVAGDYRIEVVHASRAMPWREEIELRPGANERDVALSVTVVEGRVTAPDGSPVVGSRVQAERATAPTGGPIVQMVGVTVSGEGTMAVSLSPGDGPETRTDADGYYRLRGVTPDAPLVVRVSGDAHAPATSDEVELAPDETLTGVDVTAEPAGEIEVKATRGDGSPGGGYLATASWIGDDGAAPQPVTGFVGPNGSAVLRGCRAGRWRVTLSPIGFGNEAPPPAPEPLEVEVEAGETAALDFPVE
ncbi:MAG: sigma-70 family RNA polymerase sigma factor [Planctomycetota bacterium]